MKVQQPKSSDQSRVDVTANRQARKWSLGEQVGRLLWALSFPLFRFSPRPMWAWRRWLLRFFGAKVGPFAHIYPTVRIIIPWNLELGAHCAVGDRANLYALGRIEIGPRATISQGAHLCAGTHDITRPDRPLLKLPITVRADAWVAADAFIGPGVTIGERAIVGARGVVMRDVSSDQIVAGNPARSIGKN